ncbi:SDR family oxidoreductase [Actinacidiphila sp. ITFR-21]|uniref:SDR family oxidoreductase n=1 Tax=Actinacidiphila sp. ITFR-21 TaxID=3075199 RepID=UPI00288B195F|nr:SDR family oxidoreductase [Streptomyces sp. ITFR-21]WNI16469.1 SDR family oxidoreductase [Streptomyces sp. ITFR-21]
MDLGLKGRVALVCASTGGLGLASAQALAEEGAAVAVTGRRAERAAGIAAGLGHAVGIGVDLTAPDAADTLVDTVTAALGPVDVLVLNGPGPAPGTAADLEPEDMVRAVTRLAAGHVALVRRVLPGMRERGWGRIVAIGSSGVAAPIPGLVSSNAGRAALAGYLKTLAGEVAADGVTVNLALPGRIATDRVAFLDREQAERTGRGADEVRAAAETAIPAGRYGRPDEFGTLVAFLSSTRASYITGSAVRCDGGLISGL